MWYIAAALVAFQTPLPPSIPPDSAERLRKEARKAERHYEYVLRKMVPTYHGSSGGGQNCDEIVGRFCLRYDSGEPRRQVVEVPGAVVRARQEAVEMLRKAFAALPGDLTTAGPLLRYLVEDERADEAIAAARAFSWASGDSVWGPLLEGYSLHAAEQDSLAEHRFEQGLAHLEPDERRRLERVAHLISFKERGHYDKLSPEAQLAYEDVLWRLSDPLYLTSGNEARAEHLSRHVWSRLLSVAPIVRRMHRWGNDLEQLTIRYGVPTDRAIFRNWSMAMMTEDIMVEYYDPEQLAYIPESLRTEGFPGTPAPGSPWPLENERARSGFAPATIRRLLPLDHQLSRFPGEGSIILRLDGLVALDSVAAGSDSVHTGLFLLDGEYRPGVQLLETINPDRDTVAVSFETGVVAGTYVYSLEVLEPETRLAARARYSVELAPPPAGGPALSDPIVARPFRSLEGFPEDRRDDRLRPHARLIFSPGDTIGLFAEAHRLVAGAGGVTRFRVELGLRSADEPALIARALGWVGRKLGISKPRTDPRLSWEGEGEAGKPAILAVDLPLSEVRPGLYVIELEVTDLVAARAESTSRLIRVGAIDE